jgi:hypothetical protein
MPAATMFRTALRRKSWNGDALKQLLRINDDLLQLCKFLNEKPDHGNFIPA